MIAVRPIINPDARSPYKRYAKAPYAYSALLRAWQAAVKAGRNQEADELSREHRRMCAREMALLV